jgi:hydrogenase maturation protease
VSLTVVGVGSRFGRDDAIGLVLVEGLSASPGADGLATRLWEDADALTLAGNLLEMDGPVLIVDCADMGLPGGSWRLFAGDSSRWKWHSASVSTHGLGMAEALFIAGGLGFSHPVYVFGVQPFDLSPIPEMTTEMQSLSSEILAALKSEAVRLSRGDSTGESAEPRHEP